MDWGALKELSHYKLQPHWGCLHINFQYSFMWPHPRAGNTATKWKQDCKMLNICGRLDFIRGCNIRSLVLTWMEVWLSSSSFVWFSVFLSGHLAFRWMSLVETVWNGSSISFLSPPSLLSSSLPLSVPFVPFFPFPPPVFEVLSFSQHALCLCASYQHVSLSASRCLRQAFLNRKLLQLQPCLLSSIHLSVPPSPGFVLFSAAINLLANRQQSHRLGVGIRFLALRPPKNAEAWN